MTIHNKYYVDSEIIPYPCTRTLPLVTRMNSSMCLGKGAAPASMRRIRPPSPSFICTSNNINASEVYYKKDNKKESPLVQDCSLTLLKTILSRNGDASCCFSPLLILESLLMII
jgi:hypothetical protein